VTLKNQKQDDFPAPQKPHEKSSSFHCHPPKESTAVNIHHSLKTLPLFGANPFQHNKGSPKLHRSSSGKEVPPQKRRKKNKEKTENDSLWGGKRVEGDKARPRATREIVVAWLLQSDRGVIQLWLGHQIR